MMLWRRTTACERAAQWLSLELDGELSELERVRLRRHLERCASCRAWGADVAGFTSLIRNAPPVSPAAPVAVALPGVRTRRRAAVAALATIAAAAALLSTLPQSSSDRSTGALGFRDAKQQRRFAQEHVRTELAVFSVAPTTPASPFAARALL